MTNSSLTEVAAILKKANTVVVACHVRPDGDAIGSGMALCKALENAGKKVYMLCEDIPPERLLIFKSMPRTFQTMSVKLEELDLFVCVDSAEVARIGAFA
ncbi:MAG: DHH family phosphoesterase, partial [Clostridia bacterium]|nr:DHH family phosphoesterase [Clostridia bacterium]